MSIDERRTRMRPWAVAAGVLAAALVGVGVAGSVTVAQQADGVVFAETVGNTTTPITAADRDTVFVMEPPSGAACSGDTAAEGYVWQTYMVPSTVDPASLTFDAQGPVPQGFGTDLRIPLFTAAEQSPVVNRATAADTGQLVGLPSFSFGVLADQAQSLVPEGTYNLGYACIRRDVANGTQEFDRFWNGQIEVTHEGADSFAWAPVAGVTPTSTTTTTIDDTSSSTTTTTIDDTSSTTSTTVDSSTSSTSTTSTTLGSGVGGAGGVGGTTGGGFGTTGTTGTTGGQVLVATGASSSTMQFVLWGLLALVVGRMVVLLARKPTVLPYDES